MKKEWTTPELICLQVEETNGQSNTGTMDALRPGSATTGTGGFTLS